MHTLFLLGTRCNRFFECCELCTVTHTGPIAFLWKHCYMCRIISRSTPLPSAPVQLTGFIPSALSLPGGIRCLWISLNQMFSSELILQVTLSWFLAPLFRQAPRRQCHPSLGSSWRPGWSFLKSMLCSNALSNLKNHVIHTVWTP